MLRIREAQTAEDYQVVRTLFVEYAERLGHDLCFQNFAEELATLPGAYAPPGGCVLLAAADDQWAGCVAMRGTGGGTCEMKRMYVRQVFRGQGLGRRLAEEIIERARRAGYARMRLDTLSFMQTARALYRSLGFREIAPYYHNPLWGVVFYELDLLQAGERASGVGGT